jgi:NADH:ubiquinone oxidoreductase subunit 5 (subunit L)/multisubunit Na+/H+ antiporter MnhA subunit
LLTGPFGIVIAIGGVTAILLTVAYSFGAARRVFFGPLSPALEKKNVADPPWTMSAPLFVVAATSIVLGMYPRFVMDLLHAVIGAP